MGSSDNKEQFPGFQVFAPKDEYVPIRRALSRLQRRAPRPLQLKPSVSFKNEGTPKVFISGREITLSSSTSSGLSTFYQNDKDPIPLLTPLVSPALEKTSSLILNEGNLAKSH